MRRTATTANAILGLLALRREWSTWDLTKQLRRNMRFFWPRAESQIYEEAKGLVVKGLARDRQSFTGKRGRTSYAITAKGRKQLKQWLATPPKPTALECEPLLRVFLGTLGTHDDILAALAQVRSDGEAVLDVGRVVGPEYLAGTAPFQDEVVVRAFVFDFLSHHARMLTDWADRTEAVVRGWAGQTEAERVATALEIIREGLEALPPAHPVADPVRH
ncbi:MAG TPA: PadR family transcriptional regulator [Acidimicrobiales bacterium]|nr:PadR family transcriptional regulator [Acidimicrobiales bacterium]